MEKFNFTGYLILLFWPRISIRYYTNPCFGKVCIQSIKVNVLFLTSYFTFIHKLHKKMESHIKNNESTIKKNLKHCEWSAAICFHSKKCCRNKIFHTDFFVIQIRVLLRFFSIWVGFYLDHILIDIKNLGWRPLVSCFHHHNIFDYATENDCL